jgi:iron complex transport system substrate-binding protein
MVPPLHSQGVEGVLTSAAYAAAQPHRIVCLIPNVTAMLFAMHAGPQVVGVSSFAHDPAEVDRLPKVGGLLDPDTERILALVPDLVIVYGGQDALEQRLARAGIKTFVYRHGDLRDVTKTIRSLGTLVGHATEASELADRIDRDLEAVANRVEGRPRPKTLLVLGHDPHAVRNVLASGGYGFLHDILVTAGGSDVFGDVKRESLQASLEQILARAPEAIIELHYGTASAEGLAPWTDLTTLPAVRNYRVYELVGEEFVEGGIHVAEATRKIAQALHPEAFK